MHSSVLKLCLVTQVNQPLELYCRFLQQAIQGGVTLVQFRDKTLPFAAARSTALALKTFLDPLNIPLLINDNAQLAHEIDAAGVHLGQSDLCPMKARQLLGPDKIIGLSIETLDQLQRANDLDCIQYVGLSAVFPSQTKTNCKTIWGLSGLKKASELSKHPIVAIGGITQHNVKSVMAHGAAGIALISALHDAKNPHYAAAQLIQTINQG